jgi:hypothetical protein
MTTRNHKKSLELKPLTIEQLTAVDLLLTGLSDREVSERVGVTRETITRWRLYHPVFQAELNARWQEISKSHSSHLHSLLSKSLEVIEDMLSGPENSGKVKVALSLLRASSSSLSLASDPRNSGPTNPAEIVNDMAKSIVESPLDDELYSMKPRDTHREQIIKDLEQRLGEPLIEKKGDTIRREPKSTEETIEPT